MAINKSKEIERILVDSGGISNVLCLDGTYGFRTNRLSGYIHNLKSKYIITSETYRTADGEYIDCVYTLKGKK